MKYRVGDKVKIKSLDWYNKNKDENREIKFENGVFTTLKSRFLGQIVTIEEITPEKQYILMEDRYKTLWTDEMIEGLVEEEIAKESLKSRVCECKNFFICPNGYQFKDENGNVINATKIVLEKKKPKYPKTYEECLSTLKIKGYDIVTYVPSWTEYEKALYQKVLKLQELIICRDAYWKIAGEEMGLGKSWEPDFINFEEDRYGLYTCANKIVLDSYGGGDVNVILTFPTEEMRDAFYEAFKKEIEECKELL